MGKQPKPKKPNEPWLPVEDLKAKYVKLGVAMGHRRTENLDKDPKDDGLDGLNQQSFAEAIDRQAPGEGVTRELMRDQLKKAAMRKSHQEALAAYCHGFPIDDPHWKEKSADVFVVWWTKHYLTPQDNEQVIAVRQVPGSRQESMICERLASVSISLNQSPAGTAWPLTGSVDCHPSPLQVPVAVRRAWLQIDGGARCEIKPSGNRHELMLDGRDVTLSWSGTESRPICEISTDRGYLGHIELPDDFCKVHGIRPGTTIRARLAAYMGDLTPIPNDDAEPEDGKRTASADTYSWHRPGYKTLGQATKDAIIARIETLKMQKRHAPLPGAPEGWIIMCECARTFVADESKQSSYSTTLPKKPTTK